MEFTSQEYKQSLGKVITTADEHNYVHSKMTDDYIYLKCAIFRTGCKGTSKLNRLRSLVTPMNQHNHSVEDYKTDVFRLNTKCKTIAKQSQTNLRKVFDDATRNDPVQLTSRSWNVSLQCIAQEGHFNLNSPHSYRVL